MDVVPDETLDWKTPDGALLKAYRFGPAWATAEHRVLIVACAFLPGAVYWPFAAALAENLGEDWAVFVYDRRGKGASTDIDKTYSFATELADVRTGLDYSQAHHLFGHSLGGAIVLHAAKKFNDDGELASLLSSVSVYDPAISIEGSFDTSWLEEFEHQVEHNHIGRAMTLVHNRMGMSRALSHVRTWMLSAIYAGTMRTGLLFRAAKKAYPAGTAEVIAAFTETARAKDFAGLETTTGLVTGELSADYFHETAKILAEAMPRAEHIISPKGLHGSIPAVRHHIVESMARWLRGVDLGDENINSEAQNQ